MLDWVDLILPIWIILWLLALVVAVELGVLLAMLAKIVIELRS